MANNFYFSLQKAIDIALNITLASEKKVMLKYIENHYNHGDGKIEPQYICETAANTADTINYMNFNYVGKATDASIVNNKEIVIRGYLKNDVTYLDSDPYETAGGCIKGISKQGTPCHLTLTYDYCGFMFRCYAPVSIIMDHYNNNFAGISTGNGTRNYGEGERVEIKQIKRWSHLQHDFDNHISIETIDCAKIFDFIYAQE